MPMNYDSEKDGYNDMAGRKIGSIDRRKEQKRLRAMVMYICRRRGTQEMTTQNRMRKGRKRQTKKDDTVRTADSG